MSELAGWSIFITLSFGALMLVAIGLLITGLASMNRSLLGASALIGAIPVTGLVALLGFLAYAELGPMTLLMFTLSATVDVGLAAAGIWLIRGAGDRALDLELQSVGPERF